MGPRNSLSIGIENLKKRAGVAGGLYRQGDPGYFAST